MHYMRERPAWNSPSYKPIPAALGEVCKPRAKLIIKGIAFFVAPGPISAGPAWENLSDMGIIAR